MISGLKINESIYKQNKKTEVHEEQGSINLTLLRITDDRNLASIDSQMENVNEAVNAMSKQKKTVGLAGAVLSGASTGVKKIQGTYDIWKPLVQNIATFVKIVDDISEVSIRLYSQSEP
jgi:phage-related minor tail protein